ncbi:MAG: ABC transporter substrate-binding protein, partial [Shinella sp.]
MFNRLKSMIAAGAVVAGLAMPAFAADAVIGVSIPAATHGWTGGLNYHTKRTIDRMKEAFPNIDFVLATSSSATQQVNDIEDLMARNINALVVLPFESDPLTEPVKA